MRTPERTEMEEKKKFAFQEWERGDLLITSIDELKRVYGKEVWIKN